MSANTIVAAIKSPINPKQHIARTGAAPKAPARLLGATGTTTGGRGPYMLI